MSATNFPAIGHVYEVRFGEHAFALSFDGDGRTMSFKASGAELSLAGADTVKYTAVELRPNVFMVYWQETGGTTVVHVEDFERGLVHTNITPGDGSFVNLSGTLKRVN